MNDRQLRNVVDGLGGRRQRRAARGRLRHHRGQRDHGRASAWPQSITDLKERLSRIVVGYTYDDKPVTAGDLKAAGRHGRLAEGRAQAQSGADAGGHARVRPRRPLCQHRARLQLRHGHAHGAETGRLLPSPRPASAPIWARRSSSTSSAVWRACKPDAVVVVATVRALKHHGGVAKADLNKENLEALEAGPAEPAAARGEHHAGVPACPASWPSTASPPTPRRSWRWSSENCRAAGRERGAVRGVGQGRRGRPGAGRRGGAPLRGGQRGGA